VAAFYLPSIENREHVPPAPRFVILGRVMATRTITEQWKMNTGVVVDRTAGTISGVRICGEVSANGRRYPRKVFKGTESKYENKPSHLGHDKRSFENRIAKVTNVHLDAEGFPRCTLKIKMSDPYAPKLMDEAENDPESIGLSHVAECHSHFEGGVEVIDRIVNPESVDIVTDPATNPKGFAESKGTMNRIKFALLVEQVGPKLALKKLLSAKRLAEMDGVGDMEVGEPAADATGDASLASALQELVASISKEFTDGNLSADEAGAKVTAFFKAHAGESEKPAEEPKEDPKESKKPAGTPLTLEALNAAIQSGIKAGVAPLKAEIDALKAEKPVSGAKATPKKEGAGDAKPLPNDDKDLVALLSASE
jgi:hypothetical protein